MKPLVVNGTEVRTNYPIICLTDMAEGAGYTGSTPLMLPFRESDTLQRKPLHNGVAHSPYGAHYEDVVLVLHRKDRFVQEYEDTIREWASQYETDALQTADKPKTANAAAEPNTLLRSYKGKTVLQALHHLVQHHEVQQDINEGLIAFHQFAIRVCGYEKPAQLADRLKKLGVPVQKHNFPADNASGWIEKNAVDAKAIVGAIDHLDGTKGDIGQIKQMKEQIANEAVLGDSKPQNQGLQLKDLQDMLTTVVSTTVETTLDRLGFDDEDQESLKRQQMHAYQNVKHNYLIDEPDKLQVRYKKAYQQAAYAEFDDPGPDQFRSIHTRVFRYIRDYYAPVDEHSCSMINAMRRCHTVERPVFLEAIFKLQEWYLGFD